MSNNPSISVIICTFNRSELIEDTLQSLINNSAKKSDYEILVIDNNSSDNTESIVKKFIEQLTEFSIFYYKEENQGLSFARNRGIREARAPLIAFLDDDIFADEHLIQNWISFFKDYPTAIGGGGKIHVHFDSPRPTWMPEVLLTLFGKHDFGNQIKKYKNGKYPFGGNLAYRKHIFEKVGDFNTQLGRKGADLNGGEEKELFQRISKHNDNIYYLPNASILHRVGAKRLTKAYIKGQAEGIGKSIAVMLHNKPIITKIKKLISEFLKLIASLFLFIGYFLIGNVSKGVTILQFRFWVWKGFFKHQKNEVVRFKKSS